MLRLSKSLGLLSCAALLLGGYACSGLTTDVPTDDKDQTGKGDALMRQAASCQDLEDALKDDMRARLRAAMDTQTSPPTGGSGGGVWADAGAAGGWAGGSGGSGGAATGGMGGGSAGGAAGGGSTPPDGSFTGTNTQVAGVDEADFVKTDGNRIYLVRKGKMHLISAWPAEQMSLESSVDIEGSPFEMFLDGEAGSADQKVVVYSRVDGTAIYAAAGVEPPTPSDDYGGMGGMGGGTGVDDPSIPYGAPVLTKVTVVRVAGGAPAVEREEYFDGSYVSARRNGEQVRTVLQLDRRGPELRVYPTDEDQQKAQMIVIQRLLEEGKQVEDLSSEELDQLVRDALGDVMVQENEAIIDGLSYEDWLPIVFRKDGAQISATTVACESFYIPKAGSALMGVTHVMPLDLSNLGSTANGAAILGVADTMYENGSAMILASNSGEYDADGAYQQKTYLHEFDTTTGVTPSYKASGVVDGRIYGQFALDEGKGYVRVVTTSGEQWSAGGTSNHLFVLQANQGLLTKVGDVGSLAPGEQVYSARFVGDTAYIVTFRQTDPLFVVDLSDPTQPTVLGELQIPGFSEYMHPLGDTHLLTVGRDADPNSGWSQNVALQIFDVSNRTDPKLVHKFIFDTYGSTQASYTHKAVTYFADRGLLALPFVGEGYDELTYSYRYESTLELFQVSLQNGFAHLGSMSGQPLMTNAEQDPNYTCYPPYYYGEEGGSMYQRGIFRDDVLFAVASDGVVAAKVQDVSHPIGMVRLNDPNEVPDWCWENYGGSGGGGTGGTGGATGGAGGWAGTGGSEWDGGAAGSDGGMGGSGGWIDNDAGVGGTGG